MAEFAEPCDRQAPGAVSATAVFKIGWRIVESTPEERALLEGARVRQREGAVRGICPMLADLQA